MGCICDDLEAGQTALDNANAYDESHFVFSVTSKDAYKWGPIGRESLGEEDEEEGCDLRFWIAGSNTTSCDAFGERAADQLCSRPPLPQTKSSPGILTAFC